MNAGRPKRILLRTVVRPFDAQPAAAETALILAMPESLQNPAIDAISTP